VNWKRGAFRLWIVASACWIIFVGTDAYYSVAVPRALATQALAQWTAAVNACVATEKQKYAGKGFYESSCFDNPQPNVETGSYWRYLAEMIGGPISVMTIWFAGLWIIAGFNRSRPSDN